MRLMYVGPHQAVDIESPDGREVGTVRRGESAEFPDELAESLLRQGERHWQEAGLSAVSVQGDTDAADTASADTASADTASADDAGDDSVEGGE